MALWQYPFHLVPRATIMEIYDSLPQSVDRETFDTVKWWYGRPPPDVASLGLDELSSWSEKIRIWGTDDGDRVEFLMEHGAPIEVAVWADMRDRNSGFLGRVVHLAADGDSVILTADLRVLEPTADEVARDVIASAALRFVSDPENFLRSLKRQNPQ